MIVTSLVTKDKYQEYAHQLQKDLDALGIKHDLEFVEPQRRKKEATLMRPQMLISKLWKHHEVLLHTDVDTKFLEHPDPFYPCKEIMGDAENPDVGIVRNSPRYSFSPLPFVVFALVIWPTYGGWSFLNTWRKYCEEQWDHYNDHQRMVWAVNSANANFVDVTACFDRKVIKNGLAGRDKPFKAK